MSSKFANMQSSGVKARRLKALKNKRSKKSVTVESSNERRKKALKEWRKW